MSVFRQDSWWVVIIFSATVVYKFVLWTNNCWAPLESEKNEWQLKLIQNIVHAYMSVFLRISSCDKRNGQWKLVCSNCINEFVFIWCLVSFENSKKKKGGRTVIVVNCYKTIVDIPFYFLNTISSYNSHKASTVHISDMRKSTKVLGQIHQHNITNEIMTEDTWNNHQSTFFFLYRTVPYHTIPYLECQTAKYTGFWFLSMCVKQHYISVGVLCVRFTICQYVMYLERIWMLEEQTLA